MELQDKTILLVEDEAAIALFEKKWLKNEGFNVIHAANGQEAIRLVKENPDSIDLVLMDIDLGTGIDGTETAREILKDNDIPIIFLSSHTGKDIVAKTEQITSYGYIVKGTDETILLVSIKMALKLHNAHLELKRREETLRISEEKLHNSEQRFRTLVEKAPAAITITKKGVTVYSNAVYASMFGFENLEEFVGKPIIEHFAPECRDEVSGFIKKRENMEAAPKEYESTGLRKNGQRFPLYIQADLVELPDGSATIAFFTDLTEHYHINQTLRENEERLRFVLEGGKIGFWDWDVKTGEIHRNKQLAHMLGYNLEEIELSIDKAMDFIHPDDRDKITESIYNLLKGMSSVHKMEYRMKSRAGSYRWIYDRAMVTVRNSEGNPIRVSGIQVDVTDRMRAELQLKQYAEELQTLNAAKDKFFSIISHDLRGPFWGLLGLIKELKKNAKKMNHDEVSEIADVMNHSAEETYKLLTNLLELSKLQTGRFRFTPEKLYLYTEIEDIRKLFSPAASYKSICIHNNTAEDIFILADKNALCIILRNLIDNAIKFSNSGGIILIESVKKQDFVEISVSDMGVGMNEEILKKIFSLDSDFTTRGTHGEAGSGLGLVLCQDLVRMSGGEIDVTSEENNGTRFIFTLPLA